MSLSSTGNHKKLYVASSIEELQKKAGVAPSTLKKPPRLLRNSLSEVKKKAEESFQDGDEEMSYCYYFKLIEIIMDLSNRKDGDHLHFRKLYGPDLNECINIMESLQSSLSSRYTCKREENNEKEVSERREDMESLESATQKEIVVEEMKTVPPDWISCGDLYRLINDKNVLIFDARPARLFAEHRINYPQCFNIPADILVPGVTANNLMKDLPESSVKAWIKRTTAENLVLCDWESTFSKPAEMELPIQVLKESMITWDPNEVYKTKPVILDGGLSKFNVFYPMAVFNIHSKRRTVLDLHKVEPDYDEIQYDMEILEEKLMQFEAGDEDFSRMTPPPPLLPPPTSVPHISVIPLVINKEVPIPNEVPRKPVIDRKRKPETLTYLPKAAWEDASNDQVVSNVEWDNNDKDTLNANNVNIDTKPSFDRGQKPDPKKNEEWERIRAEKERKADEEMRMIMEIPKTKHHSENQENKKKEDDAKRKEDVERLRATRIREEEAKRKEAQRREAGSEKKILNDQQESEKDQRKETTPLTHKSFKKEFDPRNGSKAISGMRRWVSSPNIAQERGLSGLKNLSNTCYMNSIIQCLSNTPKLAKFFLEQRFGITKQKAIAETFSSVVKQLWLGSEKYISCKEFKIAVGNLHEPFSGNNQQDSHEFLVYLLNWLHEAMKGCKPSVHCIDRENYSDEESGDVKWESFSKSNNTIIKDLFCGQQKSTLKCTVCGHSSITFDVFYMISLSIPVSSIDTQDCGLQDCLDTYFQGEKVSGWKCPECHCLRDATKTLNLSKLPRMLIIHLNRFEGGRDVKKIQKRVNFPLVDLRLESSTSKDSVSYSLYGISNHLGNLDSGHYTSFCWNGVQEQWYKFNDSIVSPVEDRKSMISSAAYILFYATKELLEKENYPL